MSKLLGLYNEHKNENNIETLNLLITIKEYRDYCEPLYYTINYQWDDEGPLTPIKPTREKRLYDIRTIRGIVAINATDIDMIRKANTVYSIKDFNDKILPKELLHLPQVRDLIVSHEPNYNNDDFLETHIVECMINTEPMYKFTISRDWDTWDVFPYPITLDAAPLTYGNISYDLGL